MVPGVIYGAKQDATLISLDPRVVLRELVKTGWRSRLYEISAGEAPVRALMREVQLHPVSDRPIHVDFQRLAPGEHIKVAVQVVFTGEESSVGIKRGGVLNVVRHTIEVSVDPDHIPANFTVDLTNLDINDNVRWSDIKQTEQVTPVIADRDFVIATVAAPTVVAEPEPVAGAAAAPAAPARGTKAPGKPAAKK
jgi:large subunit ribosomal protein L25